MELRGKVAWITGGARMGASVAHLLAQQGCDVVLTHRRSKSAAEKAPGISFRCDVTRSGEIRRTLAAIDRRFGRLDILVHLASLFESSPKGLSAARTSWDRHLEANAKSAYALALAAAPLMHRSRSGRIVLISDWTSASGRPRYKDYPAYYVSKAAVKAVTEALALELAPQILVNAIAPGPILPPKGLSKSEIRAVEKATPLGRWGGTDEIAKTVLFLVRTEFVTGETIRVDGGRHLY